MASPEKVQPAKGAREVSGQQQEALRARDQLQADEALGTFLSPTAKTVVANGQAVRLPLRILELWISLCGLEVVTEG